MRKTILAFAVIATTTLSGCLNTPDLENAALGAAIGCIAGEVIQNGKCATGAAVGAAGGALYNDL